MSGHRAKSQLSPFSTPRETSKQECAAVSQVLDEDSAPESFRVTQSCASGVAITTTWLGDSIKGPALFPLLEFLLGMVTPRFGGVDP